MRAVEFANEEGIGPSKVYWTAVPRSVLEAGMEQFKASGNNPFQGVERVEDLPFGVPDERIAARVAADEFAEAKMAAVRAHATQIPETSWLFTMATNVGSEFLAVEYFELVAGKRGPGGGLNGWEDDLFAGLEVAEPAGLGVAEPA
jgi:N-acetyl-1-D-myo-inositol-2-amino-2-deoxy-alpha-D-glucopyranoside deacetylase